MKNFRTVTVAVLAVITVLFAANIYFLCRLYESVREQYVATARECLVQADMMETIMRLKKDKDVAKSDFQFDLDLKIDDSPHGSVPVAKVDSMLVDRRINLFQAINTTIAYRLHTAASGFGGPTDFAALDSLFRVELNRVGLYPSRVAVLPPDSVAPDVTRGMWHIGYTILPGEPVIYNAYITPPLGSILRRTVGVIVTIALIIAALALAFWYLIRTVVNMRSLEEMKDDFTNNMTHELKTPIAIAYSANDTLLNCGKHSDPVKRERYLRMALEQLTRLAGRADDQALPMDHQLAFGDGGHPLEIFQVGSGDQLIEIFQAHLVPGQNNDVFGKTVGLAAQRPQLFHLLIDGLEGVDPPLMEHFPERDQHVAHRGGIVAGPVVIEGGQVQMVRHNV